MGGQPGAVIWFWVGPTTFTAPGGTHPYEFDYTVLFTGLQPAPVAVETRCWSTVKALFR
jgi:hypothetical protein